jgi:hypothetical protein
MWALHENGYVNTPAGAVWNQAQVVMRITGLTPLGYQAVRGWPSGSADTYIEALIAALEKQISVTADPDEKGKLEGIRDGLLSIGREVLVRVVTEAASTGRVPGM